MTVLSPGTLTRPALRKYRQSFEAGLPDHGTLFLSFLGVRPEKMQRATGGDAQRTRYQHVTESPPTPAELGLTECTTTSRADALGRSGNALMPGSSLPTS